MDETIDARKRTTNSTKSMGRLKHTWDTIEVLLASKIKFHESMPVNLLLWVSEKWICNNNEIATIETFHHKAVKSERG